LKRPANYNLDHRVLDWCKRNGYRTKALRIPGETGFPDRTVFLGEGRLLFLFIGTEQLKPAQQNWREYLSLNGYSVFSVASMAEAIEAIRGHIAG
jgi:hypothetical protein